MLHGERLTGDNGRLIGSIPQRLPRPSTCRLVVLPGRQGERRGLGLKQRLGLRKEASGWLPCPSRGGQGRHVGQPDRDRSTAAALAQAGHHLAEPPRSFVEVTGSTGNQAEVAQRINSIGWHPGTL